MVNVASYCGLTDRNYKQLVEVYEQYHPRGLEIVAFPCNQFLMQEPGSADSIMCSAQSYKANFIMMSKISVNGPGIMIDFIVYCLFVCLFILICFDLF